jgi:short-subunit dehydrogenase
MEGYAVGLLARGKDGLEAARLEIEAAGGKALAIETDVADAAQVEAAAERIERELGPIDVWVNNAMASVFSRFSEMTADEFKRVTEVTYLGQVYGTMSALKRMQARNRGKIVQVGSALAFRSIPLQSAYCGAKHGIRGFTDSLRSELIHDQSHVQLSMVQMPALNTPQFGWVKSRLPDKGQPVPPIYQPEVAAEAIFYAAHHDVRELPVGFLTEVILWGNKFFPSFGDHYLAWTGFKSQQTSEKRDPNAPNNLLHPVAGDHGAHGTFDAKAHASSVQLWARTRPLWMRVGVGLAAAAGAAVLLSGKSQAKKKN